MEPKWVPKGVQNGSQKGSQEGSQGVPGGVPGGPRGLPEAYFPIQSIMGVARRGPRGSKRGPKRGPFWTPFWTPRGSGDPSRDPLGGVPDPLYTRFRPILGVPPGTPCLDPTGGQTGGFEGLGVQIGVQKGPPFWETPCPPIFPHFGTPFGAKYPKKTTGKPLWTPPDRGSK